MHVYFHYGPSSIPVPPITKMGERGGGEGEGVIHPKIFQLSPTPLCLNQLIATVGCCCSTLRRVTTPLSFPPPPTPHHTPLIQNRKKVFWIFTLKHLFFLIEKYRYSVFILSNMVFRLRGDTPAERLNLICGVTDTAYGMTFLNG